MRAAAAIVLAVLCTALPLAGQFYGDRAGGWMMVDFRAYYCAALAQRENHNPYYATSLHQCEASTPPPYYRASAKVTVPAPYPPYALALFYPLTLLPFAAAAVLWWLALFAAAALAVYALARTARQPLLVAWAALALSLGLASLTTGNIVTLAIAAVAVAALAAQQNRIALAVCAITVAGIEPQIALPAALGLFVVVPQARRGLALVAAFFAALSIATAGVTQTLAYVTSVLPAHALSEVARDNQYSISTVLTALGARDSAAVLVGSIAYAIALVAGLLVGLRLARRYDDRALALLVPVAFSLLGGSFVHTGEIAAAVPAALLLFTRTQEQRAWLLAALILLAVPWMFATSAAMFLAPFFPVAYLVYTLWHGDRTVAFAAALASFATILALFALAATPAHLVAHAHAYTPIDPRLAEASWRDLVLGNTANRAVTWLLRAPTWAGLVAFASVSISLATRGQLVRVRGAPLQANLGRAPH